MYHDQTLLDVLSGIALHPFEGEVFRASRLTADPLAPSTMGGRWGPAPESEAAVPVLYTSLEADGAVAEVASFLLDLSPVPREQPIKLSRIKVSAWRVATLSFADLDSLGIDGGKFGERDYERTQLIGAGLAFLGADGLIAPSARWPCTNLMLFTDNHKLSETLEVVADEQVGWRAWATTHGLLPAP